MHHQDWSEIVTTIDSTWPGTWADIYHGNVKRNQVICSSVPNPGGEDRRVSLLGLIYGTRTDWVRSTLELPLASALQHYHALGQGQCKRGAGARGKVTAVFVLTICRGAKVYRMKVLIFIPADIRVQAYSHRLTEDFCASPLSSPM